MDSDANAKANFLTEQFVSVFFLKIPTAQTLMVFFGKPLPEMNPIDITTAGVTPNYVSHLMVNISQVSSSQAHLSIQSTHQKQANRGRGWKWISWKWQAKENWGTGIWQTVENIWWFGTWLKIVDDVRPILCHQVLKIGQKWQTDRFQYECKPDLLVHKSLPMVSCWSPRKKCWRLAKTATQHQCTVI